MFVLRVTYSTAADLLRVVDQELARGALLVRGEPPPTLEFRAKVALELVTGSAGTLECETEVASLLPGVGVAVLFPKARVAEVRTLAEAMGSEGEGPPVHEILTAEQAKAAKEPPAAVSSDARAASALAAARNSSAEKIRTALHGTRDERGAILREGNRAIHAYVLKNPNVTLDEVTAYAKNPQLTAEFLKLIADRKEWFSRPAIALALARNPKTPTDVAIRALDHVPAEALRQMAKGVGITPSIVAAARKKVIGS